MKEVDVREIFYRTHQLRECFICLISIKKGLTYQHSKDSTSLSKLKFLLTSFYSVLIENI